MKKSYWIAIGIIAFVVFAKSDSGRFILAHTRIGGLLYGRHFLGDFLTGRKAAEERNALHTAVGQQAGVVTTIGV